MLQPPQTTAVRRLPVAQQPCSSRCPDTARGIMKGAVAAAVTSPSAMPASAASSGAVPMIGAPAAISGARRSRVCWASAPVAPVFDLLGGFGRGDCSSLLAQVLGGVVECIVGGHSRNFRRLRDLDEAVGDPRLGRDRQVGGPARRCRDQTDELLERAEVVRDFDHVIVVGVHHDRIAGGLQPQHPLDEDVAAERLANVLQHQPAECAAAFDLMVHPPGAAF